MLKKFKNTLELVKFSHTIFVLPFALSAFLLAFYDKYPSSFGTPFFYYKIIWVVIAMASGRSGAMAFNRFIDRKIDAKNKRTMERTIPKGELTALYGFVFGIVSYIILIFAAYELNFICFVLSPIVIIFITFFAEPLAMRASKKFSSRKANLPESLCSSNLFTISFFIVWLKPLKESPEPFI